MIYQFRWQTGKTFRVEWGAIKKCNRNENDLVRYFHLLLLFSFASFFKLFVPSHSITNDKSDKNISHKTSFKNLRNPGTKWKWIGKQAREENFSSFIMFHFYRFFYVISWGSLTLPLRVKVKMRINLAKQIDTIFHDKYIKLSVKIYSALFFCLHWTRSRELRKHEHALMNITVRCWTYRYIVSLSLIVWH